MADDLWVHSHLNSVFLSLSSTFCCILHPQEGSMRKILAAKSYIILKALNLTEIEGVFHDSSAKKIPISSL